MQFPESFYKHIRKNINKSFLVMTITLVIGAIIIVGSMKGVDYLAETKISHTNDEIIEFNTFAEEFNALPIETRIAISDTILTRFDLPGIDREMIINANYTLALRDLPERPPSVANIQYRSLTLIICLSLLWLFTASTLFFDYKKLRTDLAFGYCFYMPSEIRSSVEREKIKLNHLADLPFKKHLWPWLLVLMTSPISWIPLYTSFYHLRQVRQLHSDTLAIAQNHLSEPSPETLETIALITNFWQR